MLIHRKSKIRVATLFHGEPCALRDTNIPPATDVCPHVAEYSAKRNQTRAFAHFMANTRHDPISCI